MPVKKTVSRAEPGSIRRKKTSSSSKVKAQKNKILLKKVTPTKKARIQHTFDSLPNLLIENSASASMQKPASNVLSPFSQPKTSKPSHLNPLSFRSEFEEKKKRIVWFSVGTIMIFVFSLWVVNVRAQFTDADFHLGTEELLLNQAKKDLTSLLPKSEPKPPVVPTPESPQQEHDVEKIKQILSKNLMQINTASSSTTTTVEHTATSSIFTSSTSTKYIILESDNQSSFEE